MNGLEKGKKVDIKRRKKDERCTEKERWSARRRLEKGQSRAGSVVRIMSPEIMEKASERKSSES